MLQTTAFKLAGVAILSLLIAAGAMRSQRDDARTALADHRAKAAEATAKAQAQAREKETMLLATANALSDKLSQEKRRAQATQNRLVADIRSRAQRLSIAARCPSPAGEAPAAAPAAPGAADTPRAELDPAAAEALVTLTNEGDEAIRERNACIQQYNAAREALNGH